MFEELMFDFYHAKGDDVSSNAGHTSNRCLIDRSGRTRFTARYELRVRPERIRPPGAGPADAETDEKGRLW